MAAGTPDINYGGYQLRIRQDGGGFRGIIVGHSDTPYCGPTYEAVRARLIRAVHERHPSFIGLDGARRRFLDLFPEGCADPAYGGARGEAGTKRQTSEWFRGALPADAVAAHPDPGAVAARAIGRTQLVGNAVQATRLGNVLKSERGRDFLRIAADFSDGNVARACDALARDPGFGDVSNWVCMTLFPFLWRPDAHLFLKPTVMRTFAERIGHGFQHAYCARPNPETYGALLDMGREVREWIADLGARDMIDVHSFIWATVKYRDPD